MLRRLDFLFLQFYSILMVYHFRGGGIIDAIAPRNDKNNRHCECSEATHYWLGLEPRSDLNKSLNHLNINLFGIPPHSDG